LALVRGVWQLRGRIARPPRPEHFWWQRPQLGAQASSTAHWYQKVEIRLGLDPVQELDGEVFRIGQDQCLAGLGIEDVTGQLQQFQRCGGGSARRSARGETDGLARVDVEHEKSLSDLGGPLPITAMDAHVALAEAAYAMGIESQQPPCEMA